MVGSVTRSDGVAIGVGAAIGVGVTVGVAVTVGAAAEAAGGSAVAVAVAGAVAVAVTDVAVPAAGATTAGDGSSAVGDNGMALVRGVVSMKNVHTASPVQSSTAAITHPSSNARLARGGGGGTVSRVRG